MIPLGFVLLLTMMIMSLGRITLTRKLVKLFRLLLSRSVIFSFS